MSLLAEATRAYQAQVEHSRRARELELPDHQIRSLDEDLEKARNAMEIAWLEWSIARPPNVKQSGIQ